MLGFNKQSLVIFSYINVVRKEWINKTRMYIITHTSHDFPPELFCVCLFDSLIDLLLIYSSRRTGPQKEENIRAHWNWRPAGVTDMSCWGEGKASTLLYPLLPLKKTKKEASLFFLFRVHPPLRATWRVLQACWRLTFQTTKIKSCAFYVLCKFIPALSLLIPKELLW